MKYGQFLSSWNQRYGADSSFLPAHISVARFMTSLLVSFAQ
jgi:hypothetical protein